MNKRSAMPFLRVPPFPGARHAAWAAGPIAGPGIGEAGIGALLDILRSDRVGGTYWGSQPPLPSGPYTLIRPRDRDQLDSALSLRHGGKLLVWSDASPGSALPPEAQLVQGGCDPWHLLSGATEVAADADDELALMAAISGVELVCLGRGRFSELQKGDAHTLHAAIGASVAATQYTDPFTGEPATAIQAARLCAFWRRLIDANRNLSAAVGFAAWKRGTVAPLLWSGQDLPFRSRLPAPEGTKRVAVWRSRCSAAVVTELATRQDVTEVEDGFIRSAGLGAECVPPLSIVVDPLGIYFDPHRPSELERIIEGCDFPSELLARARELRQAIVTGGVSKYRADTQAAARRAADRRHILVPGQVEDDRSVLEGGTVVRTNQELLRRVRESAPDAYILYKPHPDVEAGHRIGAIPDQTIRTLADEVVRGEAISPLIAMVDEVHVNTSLAGFEALLHGKAVTTYGNPFYAGWGLTDDRAPPVGRRTKRRSLDELVAAVLLVYPRYLDPMSGLPCPPEVLIRRLSDPAKRPDAAIVRLRRAQGWLKRLWGTVGRR